MPDPKTTETCRPRIIIDFIHGSTPRRRVFVDPVDSIVATSIAEVRPALRAIEDATRQGRFAAGYISYEAAPAFDAAFSVHAHNQLPLLWFGIFDQESSQLEAPAGTASLEPLTTISAPHFNQGVQTIRDAIAEGRTYQVNLTDRLRFRLHGDARSLYETLRAAQGPGFHAFIKTESFTILSLSPELFFRRTGDNVIARPMKGTSPRGRWKEEDDFRAAELLGSEKERAENLMIVDMMRNDLGRIAQFGSVHVSSLFDIERYRTVLQMTSTVSATIPDHSLTELLTALFPSGSVTGAPKISTMQMIAELESSPREVYCGAVGLVEPGGDCTFNVPIRTLWVDRASRSAEYGVGAGITWDSHPESEYREVMDKAAFLQQPWPVFDLFETFRIEHRDVPRIDRHLARLRSSCEYFDYAWDNAAVHAAIDDLRSQAANDLQRGRIFVNQNGQVHTSIEPLDPLPAERRVALAADKVSSADRFLFHKTTNRIRYDRQLAQRPGSFDVLLWNERGELTEFTRGNLVVDLHGRLCTPPRSAGLLAGAFRQQLLDEGTIVEQTVLVKELPRANAVWFINSLREWVSVTLA